MRAQLTITTDTGVVYTGEVELASSERIGRAGKAGLTRPVESSSATTDINFDLPVRPFMKKYAQSMSGPKRLTLLIARLAQGDTQALVQRVEIGKLWNKMTLLMGGRFNPAYDTRARENGWVNSPKPGTYVLLPTWREVFLK